MGTAHLHIIDYIIIAVFLLMTVYFGLSFAKKQDSTQEYFAANGKIPSWVIGFSILSTLISSVTFLAYPGEGYSSNWILLVQGLMVPIVLLTMIWFIVPLYRKVIGLSTLKSASAHLPAITARWALCLPIFQKWARYFSCCRLHLPT